uniref:Uncharacterized protein n=1 Tax=Alexandrium monilatum TaxID=311494 RepID=A0A7S4QB69_9DINO
MGSKVQDDSLQEIESLIMQMEALERRITEKREQKAFVAGVIREKQQQCQQAKEQHEEKISALARQARKSRGRKAPREGAALASVGTEALGPPQQADSGGPAASEPREALNLQQLAKAFGKEQLDSLLGPLAAGSSPARAAAGAAAEERLETAKRALEERLDLLQCLNSTLQHYTEALPRASGAAQRAIQTQVEALQPEVASFIDVGIN